MASVCACRPLTVAAYFLLVAERVASLLQYQANTTANKPFGKGYKRQEFNFCLFWRVYTRFSAEKGKNSALLAQDS